MDSDSTPDGLPSQFEAFIRSVFGSQADEVIAAMRSERFDPQALIDIAGLPDDPATQAFVIDKVRRAMMAPTGGEPVNWDTAHDLAREAANTGGDPAVTASESRQVAEAIGVAELWLDAATQFPASGGTVRALSAAEWVEITWPAWQRMVSPVAASVANVLTQAIAKRENELPGELAAGLRGMMRTMGGAVFAMQIGQAIGALAREVFGLTDIGLPLTEARSSALLPAAIGRFAAGLDAPIGEVRLFLAVREAATARLFTHVHWLGPHLLGAVEGYARGIEIDVERIETALRDLDLTDQAAVNRALTGGAFAIQRTPAQKAALERLETTLALVEGWVEDVVSGAVAERLPSAAGLSEMIRRRRAGGGPAERAFGTLVGLELRPRRAREAAALWRAVAEADGLSGREALWSHPDVLPDSQELAEPELFVQGRRERAAADADVDAAIAELLNEDDSR